MVCCLLLHRTLVVCCLKGMVLKDLPSEWIIMIVRIYSFPKVPPHRNRVLCGHDGRGSHGGGGTIPNELLIPQILYPYMTTKLFGNFHIFLQLLKLTNFLSDLLENSGRLQRRKFTRSKSMGINRWPPLLINNMATRHNGQIGYYIYGEPIALRSECVIL